MYYMRLCTVGNPDHGQSPTACGHAAPTLTIASEDLEELKECWIKYRDWYDIGGGNCPRECGGLFNDMGIHLGNIHYNGRIDHEPDKTIRIKPIKSHMTPKELLVFIEDQKDAIKDLMEGYAR